VCKNQNCGREFELAATITTEKKATDFTTERTTVSKYCCPFCESLSFRVKKESK